MRSTLKRALSEDGSSISPPPTRRKVMREDPYAPKESPAASGSQIRIFSWNVNGVGPFLQRSISFSKTATPQSPLRIFLERHNWPHILCLQEVKISRKDTATIRALQRAANLDPKESSHTERPSIRNPTYTIHLSLPRDKYNATGYGGKVYGVATLIRDDLPTTLNLSPLKITTRAIDWDLEGRVLITTLSVPTTLPPFTSVSSSPNSTHLSIIHAYWPNGTIHPDRCPRTGNLQGTRHDYKLRFHAHMLREARSLSLSLSHHVLLVGDMNIAPARIDGFPNLRTSPVQHVTNRQDFNQRFLGVGNGVVEDSSSSGSVQSDGQGATENAGFDGVDVWRHLKGDERRYTYFPRGRKWGSSCDRVDLVVAGRSLLEAGMGGGAGGGRGRGGQKEEERDGSERWEATGGAVVVDMQIYDNELDRGHSDHVPLSVTLDLARWGPLAHSLGGSTTRA